MGTSGAGGAKNKKERYHKISSVAMPRAISGLIRRGERVQTSLFSSRRSHIANVLKIIADAYSELLTSNRRKAQQQRLPYVTPRSIAAMHLLAFSCLMKTYRDQHLRVEYFVRFGFDEVGSGTNWNSSSASSQKPWLEP
ncbi:hypothetical protein F441_01869 [Phytophthora nicotianae CJ01A1]|uniref:Uncharacterized protein n=4 Tax=Phytophthora nicotianae TaxID=4792 RepID=W2QRJ6_PHYN3|nr:hypothetical protein PPTG_06997 [Phytophthora nicotianae INRA-310]ETN15802.1 hypothetical protein PPTG_06997 [Phytophthora nicotianae INRA-310]ETO84153.1 hypothetical protein F444_01914 [Phytophthora nicotianae P1976]ETP25242.1 hypothetical protein F441_01869 [Phytophthora nicotianae CJ01A1]ETP53231.1 hypothetical protein F442_01847 [Phytophthora nicotianae P10297]